MTKEHPFKIAILTPTYNRDQFLLQTQRYVHQQKTDAEIRWFVIDDSAEPSAYQTVFQRDHLCDYRWMDSRITLGQKRNLLNELAQDWGAHFICSMDDDDWYGADYVAEMTELLLSEPESEFAGSGEDFYYDVKANRILRIPAVTEFSSCNGVLCYKASALHNRQYDNAARSGEERSFLQSAKVLQHPSIQKLHLALAHSNNTVTKKNYCRGHEYFTELSLNDFPMDEQDKAFYLELHAKNR